MHFEHPSVYIYFTNILYVSLLDCTGGIMFSVLTSSAVDRGFEP